MSGLATFEACRSLLGVCPVLVEELVVLVRLDPQVELVHLLGNLLVRVLKDLHQGSGIVAVAVSKERVRYSVLASATCTSYYLILTKNER